MAARKKNDITLREACAALEHIAPTALAQSWDNVGLLAGELNNPVRRILLCIDLMPPVVREAIRRRADLVVAYHPPIFRPLSRLISPSEGMEAGVLQLISRGTAVYSPHTALDATAEGTNDVLATLCGAVSTTPLQAANPEKPNDDPTVGIGRVGRLKKPATLVALARSLKRRSGARCVSAVGEPERMIRRAICLVGAAGSLPFDYPLNRHDVIVTGEIRHHDALRMQRRACSAIALSHWSSERPALATLSERLGQLLPKVKVMLSEQDSEPFWRV